MEVLLKTDPREAYTVKIGDMETTITKGKYIQTLLGHKDPRMVQRYQATINSQDALNAIRSKGNKRRLI
jgi:integrase